MWPVLWLSRGISRGLGVLCRLESAHAVLSPPQDTCISNKRPSASLGLRHLGPLCEPMAYLEANP